jgi:hypothetical protein
MEHAMNLSSTITATKDITPRDSQTRDGGTREATAKQTIALVDDDRNILTSVQMTLEQEGCST